ncbi:MAG: HAMP domain-containing sensor histidine kinase [Tissierellia bacterium]|nr:HAMP domain-containing sensor histidine kinase [Tissierellia bacterium]
MNTKEYKRKKYPLIRRGIFIRCLTSTFFVGIGGFLLYQWIRGNTAQRIIRFFAILTAPGTTDPEVIYNSIIRNNMTGIIKLYIIFGFLFVGYITYVQVHKYVEDLLSQVENALEETSNLKEVKLSPDLDVFEEKIRQGMELLKRKEKDAQIELQRKNELVMYLAHDIKTPLTSIIGYLNLLLEAEELKEKNRQKYLKIAYDKSLRLEELIQEFFEITRYNLQSMTLSYEEIDVSYMLAQMGEEFYPVLLKDGKTWSVKVPDELKIMGDSNKLARVFQNILKNGIAYGFPGTTVEVLGIDKGEDVWIQCINYGEEIPEYKLESIFEEFYRLDEARSTNTGGSGLGLSIAKRIVELHGGKILAESRDGKTVFTVILPKTK